MVKNYSNKMRKSIMFFRNDDVRATIDRSLVELTDLFIKHEIPITHALEPANLTLDVVNWLIDLKKRYPHLIEIMQHGYDHTIKNKQKMGEFGGQRDYDEQYNDIKKGKDLMDKYFGNLWFRAFNFPFGPHNLDAVRAVDDCNFVVLNSHFNRKTDRQIFYFFGHLLNKGIWLNHRISWNLDYFPNTNLFSVDMNISFISRYINDDTECEMLSIDTLKKETIAYSKYRTIGLLLHHRYHNTPEKVKLVDDYLGWAREQNYSFSNMQGIYERFKK
jgi:hypothetical protein